VEISWEGGVSEHSGEEDLFTKRERAEGESFKKNQKGKVRWPIAQGERGFPRPARKKEKGNSPSKRGGEGY